MYVIHEYPGVFSENVTKNKDKADARFHAIHVSLRDQTTFKLIGESICTKDGMQPGWAEICDQLYDSLGSYASHFMGDPGDDLDAAGLKKIFPIHPMTVNLVSKVAGMSASNRSIFQFLKSNDDNGFRAYIHNNGQYDWKWVTADYLWDYYFVSNLGGKKDMTQMAEDCLKHYSKIAYSINDVNTLRVFKAAVLLLATIGSTKAMRKSKGAKGIQATEKTLVQCFCGQLSKDDVSKCLDFLKDDLHALALAPDGQDDRRIELPYSGT